MAKLTRTQTTGVVILILSPLIGLIGTVWSVYSSFTALDTAEFGGIGPVGDQISNALLFSAGGVAGCVVGVLLLVFGKAKKHVDQRTRPDR